MGCFLYPRTITIKRAKTDASPGAQPYSGTTPTNEDTLFQNIAAHIEAEKAGAAPPSNLPANSQGEPIYLIIFKLPLGAVADRDIIVDDLNLRYQVISTDWGPLVTTCRSKKLEN